MSNPLIDFLSARLAEDEANAARQRVIAQGGRPRLLREVQAHREIVAEHTETAILEALDGTCDVVSCLTCSDMPPHDDPSPVPVPCPTLRSLAAIWSDHPEYDVAWRP